MRFLLLRHNTEGCTSGHVTMAEVKRDGDLMSWAPCQWKLPEVDKSCWTVIYIASTDSHRRLCSLSLKNAPIIQASICSPFSNGENKSVQWCVWTQSVQIIFGQHAVFCIYKRSTTYILKISKFIVPSYKWWKSWLVHLLYCTYTFISNSRVCLVKTILATVSQSKT